MAKKILLKILPGVKKFQTVKIVNFLYYFLGTLQVPTYILNSNSLSYAKKSFSMYFDIR